jgi:hypothetical protein
MAYRSQVGVQADRGRVYKGVRRESRDSEGPSDRGRVYEVVRRERRDPEGPSDRGRVYNGIRGERQDRESPSDYGDSRDLSVEADGVRTAGFSLYSLRARQEEQDRPSKTEIAEFLMRMRQEDDLATLTSRARPAEADREYETSLVLAQKQIKMLEEALHNEKLVSEAMRRKLAIYNANLPTTASPLFSERLGEVKRSTGSVTEWRVRLDEVQKTQLDRLTARR